MFFNADVIRQVFSMSRNLAFEGFTFEIIIDQKDKIAFIVGTARGQNFVKLGKTPPSIDGSSRPL